MPDTLEIKTADVSHASLLAELHEKTFPGLVSTRLGRDYLIRSYSQMLTDRNSACFIAREGDAVAGFICGTADRAASGDGTAALGAALLSALFSGRIRPAELPGLWRYRRWAGRVKLKAELESLLVLPSFRGRGAGRLLVRALTGYFRSRGVREFCVLSDDLVSTGIGFYKKLGFSVAGEYHHGAYTTVCLRSTIA